MKLQLEVNLAVYPATLPRRCLVTDGHYFEETLTPCKVLYHT